jgi:hypothetical protein
MAEYNLVCVNCMHTPHAAKPCAACTCKQFLRADVQAVAGIAMILNTLEQLGQVMIANLYQLNEVVGRAYPEAKAGFDQHLAEQKAAFEAEMEKARAERMAQAEAAYKEATGDNLVEGNFTAVTDDPACD